MKPISAALVATRAAMSKWLRMKTFQAQVTCHTQHTKSRPTSGTVLETWRNNTMTTRKPSNMIAHTFFSRVGSTTLRSTARQTCQCPRRLSKACATNPAWAHKTYPDLSCRRVAAGGARKKTTLQWPAVLAANTHADNQKEPAEAATCEDTSEHASQENT